MVALRIEHLRVACIISKHRTEFHAVDVAFFTGLRADHSKRTCCKSRNEKIQ